MNVHKKKRIIKEFDIFDRDLVRGNKHVGLFLEHLIIIPRVFEEII